MIVGILGAGHLGSSVGRAIALGGHDVIFASRHPERLRVADTRIHAAKLENCAREAEVLLLATPYRALLEIARTLGSYVEGKVVLDATNPDPFDHDELSETSRRDGMGVTTQRYLSGARVVRAFSSINAGNVTRSREKREPLAIPIAGDDGRAIATAEQLVLDAGCVPVTVGDLASGRIFEWGNPGCFVNTNESELRRILGL